MANQSQSGGVCPNSYECCNVGNECCDTNFPSCQRCGDSGCEDRSNSINNGQICEYDCECKTGCSCSGPDGTPGICTGGCV